MGQDARAGGAVGAGAAAGHNHPMPFQPGPSPPGKPPPGSYEAKMGRARCGISIDQQVFNFVDAMATIVDAANSCNETNKTGFDSTVCAEDITNFLQDMAWWVSYLSLAPMWCGATQSGGCVSDSGWFSGMVLEILGDSLGAYGDCNLTNSTSPFEPINSRRLLDEKKQRFDEKNQRLRSSLNISEDRALDMENCIYHINSITVMSTKLGYQTWAAAHGCKAGGPGAIPGMLCSSSILTLVADVPYIAANIANIIGACPSIVRNETIPQGYCAGDALDFAGTIVDFGSWATTFTKDCHMLN